MKMDDEKISFENILVTPLERWIDADVDLDPVAVERLNRLAALSNQSVDNVLNHILADFFAEHLELSEERRHPARGGKKMPLHSCPGKRKANRPRKNDFLGRRKNDFHFRKNSAQKPPPRRASGTGRKARPVCNSGQRCGGAGVKGGEKCCKMA